MIPSDPSRHIATVEDQIRVEKPLIEATIRALQTRIVGQASLLERLVLALIADGHVLLEGLPGLAKTTAIKALAGTTSLSFSRVQFTPDLLPADLIGTQIYDPRALDFKVKKGPIFAHIVLADEVNRAPAKVQSALLEAMQERQVTIGTETFHLDEPFMVLATQNPIDQEGTYPLPEAQVDRFFFKIRVGYGTPTDECEILSREFAPRTGAQKSSGENLEAVLHRDDLLRLRELSRTVYVSDRLRQYIVNLVFATRSPEQHGLPSLKNQIQCGASPRASINLERAARALALVRGRGYVVPQDVKDIAHDVLRHRILLSYEAEADNILTDDLVTQILGCIAVP